MMRALAILSGKGGVGKSTFCAQLAICLANQHSRNDGHELRIGVLDIDLTGPSQPSLFGLEKCKVKQGEQGWIPVKQQDRNIWVVSVGFLMNENDAVIWRGPRKTAVIKQLLSQVEWPELDFLLIDTPPGTSDEHMTLFEQTTTIIDCAILITTPQQISILDVTKEINFCKKADVDILGIVENMSGYVCPHCDNMFNVFASQGGHKLAEEYAIPFLGSIPIDPSFNFENFNQNISARMSIESIADKILVKFFPAQLVCVAELNGHSARIWDLKKHPTLPLIATCSQDQTIRIWSSKSFECISIIANHHKRSIRAIAWIPDIDKSDTMDLTQNFHYDGSIIGLSAASFDGTVSIWKIDVESLSELSKVGWECESVLEGHENEVKSVAWSKSGLLATCSRDKSVWIWNYIDNEFDCLSVLQDHTQDVKCVKWHPTQDVLCSGSYDNTIRVWVEDESSDDWKCLQTLKGHQNTVWSLDFNHDGSKLVSASADGSIRIWIQDAQNIQGELTLTNLENGHSEYWTCTGSVLIDNSDPLYSVSWLNNSIATAGQSGCIYILECESSSAELKLVCRIESAHSDLEVNNVSWTMINQHRMLLSAGDDNIGKVWRYAL